MVRSPSHGENRSAGLPVAVLTLLLACTTPLTAQRTDDPVASGEVVRTAYHDFRVVEIADGLINPHSIAFTPEGDVLGR